MRPTIKHFASCLALTMAFFATLISCSKEDVAGDQLPDGKYPVNLTATMEGVATRAISDNAWEGGEEVAVRIGNEVKKYTVTNAANGTLTAHSDNEPFYWQSTTETKSISAWSPFSVVKPSSFSVEADQSAEGYQASDLIYTLQTVTYINNSITFRHLPAKVVVHLKAGLGITQAEVRKATVTLLNQNLTSGTIADDWSVTQQPLGSTSIIPKNLATPADGYHKSVEAIVVPQTIAAGARMLQVSIGGGLFYYTPIAEQSLAAGNQYNYQITVNATGLSVTTQISDWTTEEVTGDAEMEEPPIGSKSASQAAIGDFYFSDGTLEDKDATLTDEQKMACIGIVFYAGKHATDDSDYSGTGIGSSSPHGYVVALQDAEIYLIWEDKDNNWATGVDVGTSTSETDWKGYFNCQQIRQYVSGAGWTLADFPAANACFNFGDTHPKYAAPSSNSGWFMPSFAQLKHLYDNRDILSSQIEKLKGISGTTDVNWFLTNYYWSSSEDSNRSSHAWSVYFYNGNIYANFKSTGMNGVRAVSAF